MTITATHQGRPLDTAVYFQLGDRVIYKYGASSEKLQHLWGANLVMCEANKQLARNGARTLHLGRTSLGNEDLRWFRLGWGGGEQKIEYTKNDLREDRIVTETDTASDWRRRVFRVLPQRMLLLIGAAQFRHCA